MSKRKSYFECSECGHEEGKWLGRCPSCGRWNTFLEIALPPGGSGGGRRASGGGAGTKGVSGAGGTGGTGGGDGRESAGRSGRREAFNPTLLSKIDGSASARLDTGIGEMDRVLGGGITVGSSILIGGEPGIGKSTLMLQLASMVRADGPVAYVSGEESAGQIKMRAERLGVLRGSSRRDKAEGPEPYLICETDLERIVGQLRKLKARVAVVDSIQTLLSAEAGNVPGTVNQLKYGCYELIDWARESNGVVFLIAHVTKEGAIAGPKVIEHMVDTVLYFDQGSSGLRILRAVKNRFGSVDEIGIFTMEREGLIQVADPASFFLEQRDVVPPGIAAAPVYEGSRVLMVEIQALVIPAKGGYTRIYSDRIDSNRVSRVAAVLEKHLSLRFSDRDIYVNVAGGIKLDEVGIELPLALALYSAWTEIAVPEKVAAAGEISLAGEIRPTPHMQRRVRTAGEMGFTRFYGASPAAAGAEGYTVLKSVKEGIQAVFGKLGGSSGRG
ncbi:MAG: DNA repair protein RadA [Spirochaetaceae bacterium]